MNSLFIKYIMKRSNNQISQITTEEEKQEIFNIKNIIKQ